MKVEQIELHGGPRHGEVLAIPAGVGSSDDLAMSVVIKNPKTKALGFRQGHYTRVHKINANPTNQFEWIGFTSPFVPLSETSSA